MGDRRVSPSSTPFRKPASVVRFLEEPLEERSEESKEARRGLADCDGYWIKTPTGGGYPYFAVAECVLHPQNIPSSATWLIITCEGCVEREADGPQSIACATGEDAIVETPSPVGDVNVGTILGSSLPGAGPSICDEVTVTGVREGAYTAVGELNGRPEFESNNGNFDFFFAGAAPALEIQGRRELLAAWEDREGEPLVHTSMRRDLSTCSTGYWYITPHGQRYPAHAVSDCAFHPADIASTDWVYLDCESCEVEPVSTKPDVSCTGAPENAKRGGTFSTPAPVNTEPGATPAPISPLVSTCTDVVVTGDFGGNFSSNSTYRGKMDFFSEDGEFNLYFELAVARRALLAEQRDIDERVLPGDVMASALEEASAVTRNLALCTTGYWIIAATSGSGYPVFGVPDCAEHPADIRGNAWLVASCETCGVVEAPSFVAPTVTCADQVTSGGDEARDFTPAPVGIASDCETVYVTGPAAGVYAKRGTQGNRGDFFSNNRVWNMYWVFYAGKPENRNRFRRGLSMPNGVYGQGEGKTWTEMHDLAFQKLAADLRRQGLPTIALEVATDEGDGGLHDHGGDAFGRRLEYCEDGFWLITPRGGGFPFYGTKNCATHPADMSSYAPWSVVECDGCGSQPLNASVAVSCDGVGFTPPPSPVAEEIVTVGTPSPVVASPIVGANDTAVGTNETASSGAFDRRRGGSLGSVLTGVLAVAAAIGFVACEALG